MKWQLNLAHMYMKEHIFSPFRFPYKVGITKTPLNDVELERG
jgi:hypothetical protein